MAILQAADIGDLVVSTQKDLGRMKFNSIANRVQRYHGFRNLMRKERVMMYDGTESQQTLMVDHNNSARMTALFATDVVNRVDVLKTISVPYRHMTGNYSYDLHELKMNRGKSEIVNLVKTQRAAAMISIAEKCESQFWAAPSSSTDTSNTWGVPYWLVYNATTGFNGGHPTGFTDVAGLSATTYTRWKNFSGQFTNVTKADLIRKMREGATKCSFEQPTDIPEYSRGGARIGYYTNYDNVSLMEELLEAQNDNLGNDLASKDSVTLFRRYPVVWVPQLDSGTPATADPVYGINWEYFKVICLADWFLKETGPFRSSHQHNVQEVHIDLSFNLSCDNRRESFVIAKSDPTA